MALSKLPQKEPISLNVSVAFEVIGFPREEQTPTMSFKVRFADQSFSGNDATLMYVAALHRWGV